MSKKREATETFKKVKRLHEIMQMEDPNERLHKLISFCGRYRLWYSERNEVLADEAADIICPKNSMEETLELE